MHARLGAAVAAVILALALGWPLSTPALARPAFVSGASVTAGGIDPKCADYPCYTLTVVLQGQGSGRWQTTDGLGSLVPDGKVNCRLFQGTITADSTCSHEYVDILRTGSVAFFYRVTPDFGSRACVAGVCKTDGQNFTDGLGPNDKSLLAGFNLQSYGVTVTATGSGKGFWAYDPAGNPCGSGCFAYQYGATVEIEAVPQSGSRFGGWTGACTGQQAQCLLGITGNLETSVIFELEGAEPTATHAAPPSKTPTSAPPAATPAPDPTASAVLESPAGASDSPTAAGATSVLPTGPAESGAAPEPEPAAGGGSSGLIPIIIAVAAVLLLLIAIATALAMRRKPAP